MNVEELTKDRRLVLSTLWIFVTLNYLYCDILSLMSSKMLNVLLTGKIGGIKVNETTLLFFGIIMEISITMVLLSRLLKYKVNGIINIISGFIMTIIMIGTLFMGASYHYMFFAAIEMTSTMFIIWYAWTCIKSLFEASNQQII